MFGCCFYVGSIYMIRPEAAGQFLLIISAGNLKQILPAKQIIEKINMNAVNIVLMDDRTLTP